MNIFALDYNPKLAARMHCDQHINKMILESAQMLSTVLRELLPPEECYKLYKATHAKHPCTLWAGARRENFAWVVSLAEHLHRERLYRFSQTTTHASLGVIVHAYMLSLEVNFPEGEPVGFAMAMPEDCWRKDPVEAYRVYYAKWKMNLGRKEMPSTWTRRPKPDWIS
jgi:hypothetical protein